MGSKMVEPKKPIAYCSQKRCTHNKNYHCKIIANGGKIHLKFQEDSAYDIHGEFVCKEMNIP